MKPFELVIEEHGPAILRFCAGRVGQDRAEDCFQETMLAALRSYGEVKDEKALKSWLFTIATRKSIDMYRKRGREPDATNEVDHIASGSQVDQPGNNDIWSLVDQLPEKQRSAIHLRFRGSLNHREVGQAMGISESAARRNVFEGLKTLRSGSGAWS